MKWAATLLLGISGIACGDGTTVVQAAGQTCVTVGGSGLQAAVIPEDLLRDLGLADQVMIEVEILTVDNNDQRDLGIDLPFTEPILDNVQPLEGGQVETENQSWNVPSDALGGGEGLNFVIPSNQIPGDFLPLTKLNFVAIPGDIVTAIQMPFGRFCVRLAQGAFNQVQGFPGLLSRGLPAFDAGYGGYQIQYNNQLDQAQVQSILQFAQQDARAVVLTAPRILTLNNKQAAVQIIDRFQVPISDLQPEQRTEVEKTTANPFSVETGFGLDVTPHIRGDGTIIMELKVGTSALIFDLSTPVNIGVNQADLGLPVIQRSVNTSLIPVRSGNTLVLGGLIDMNQAVHRGVPALASMPILGNLFRGKVDDMHSPLIVFITPTIVQSTPP